MEKQNRNRLSKDEMNLAEFPLAVIGKRPPRGVKTLSFADEIVDPGSGAWVQRAWTVTGSDLLGLPTSVDEAVLVGCLKLTRNCGLELRKVPFTAAEFLEELRWQRDGRSYRRLAESLDRWTATTVFSNDAFWHKGQQKRIKDTFSLLDRWKLQDESGGYQGKRGWFVWGDFMWESLQAGNIKNFDFQYWLDLKSPVARRLFRFLDKRFYRRREVQFPLKQLAFEKVGMSRRLHTGQIKAVLAPAHEELQARGFCQTRYLKRGRGDWLVVYEHMRAPTRMRTPTSRDPLWHELQRRNVDNAATLLERQPRSRILQALENFDDRKAHGENLGPGWLASCILSETPYQFRQGYRSKQDLAQEKQQRELQLQKQAVRQQRLKEQTAQNVREELAQFEKFVQSLAACNRLDNFREQALAQAIYRQYYEKSLARGDAEAARQWEREAMKSKWKRECRGHQAKR